MLYLVCIYIIVFREEFTDSIASSLEMCIHLHVLGSTPEPSLSVKSLPFQRLVHEIAQDFKTDLHFQSSAHPLNTHMYIDAYTVIARYRGCRLAVTCMWDQLCLSLNIHILTLTGLILTEFQVFSGSILYGYSASVYMTIQSNPIQSDPK
jgi:hypothetical protein